MPELKPGSEIAKSISPGLTMTELHEVLGRNYKAHVVRSALMLLAEQRLARVERADTGKPGPAAE